VDRIAATDRVPEWTRMREEILSTVVREGWDGEVGGFTESFGSTALDASNLMMAIEGFLR
jgi:hypothetical protein